MLSAIISVVKVTKAFSERSSAKIIVIIVLVLIGIVWTPFIYKLVTGKAPINNFDEICDARGVGTHAMQYDKPDGTKANTVLICNQDGSSQLLH